MNKLTHFAVYTDDTERAAAFYQTVFNWQTQSYGQQGFMQLIHSEEQGSPIGALQDRMYAPVPERINAFECSIEVANVDETLRAVERAGGRVVMPVTEIPHVGRLFKFTDTEGNLLCAIQYAVHPQEGKSD